VPLVETLERLRRLSAGSSATPVAPDLDWADLIGPPDLLRREIREALHCADSGETTTAMAECWRRLSSPACQESFRRGHAIARARRPEQPVPIAERQYRHAVWMVASGGAAAALRRERVAPLAWSQLARWWRGGIERFGGVTGEVPPVPPRWNGTAVREAAAQFSGAGWDIHLLAFWTAWWLGERGAPASVSSVPLAGYFAGTGFLADLALTEVDPRGGFAIEHPDGALRPLGGTLVETILAAAGKPRKGIAWRIVPRAEFPAGALPLDGDSLGAAAWAGLALFDADLAYDTQCLLLAATSPDGALRPVGGEVEKLNLAKAQGFRKAGVAFDSNLSADDLTRAGPPITRRLRTVSEATRFARLTQAAPPRL
jgi:hypothetical protein